MAQVINTNVAALFAGSALNKSANALQTAQARLSSGLRINSAKDDATGMGIAMGIDSQIRGTNMAIRTANDGISNAQTADGLLSQVNDNLQRMREIAVQTKGAGSVESVALATENTRILGLAGLTSVPAGTTVVNNANGTTYATTGAIPTLAATSASAATAFDTDIAAVATARSGYGADMGALSSAVANLQTASVNLSAAYSRIMDTDYAAETAAMTRNNILQQAGTAVLAQANQTPNTVMSLLR
jgi:flagellin